MLPSLLSEQVYEAQLAERRREVAALQRGIVASRAMKQARRDRRRSTRVVTSTASAPAAPAAG
jgi:hypothetical protein